MGDCERPAGRLEGEGVGVGVAPREKVVEGVALAEAVVEGESRRLWLGVRVAEGEARKK